MALTVANHVAVQGTSSATSITSPSFASTTGNLVVANPQASASRNVTSVTDVPVNLYSSVGVTAVSAGGNRVAQWYAPNIIGDASHTVTATFDVSNTANLFVVEVSGAATGGVLDQKTARAQAGVAQFTTEDVTTTRDETILVAAMSHDGSGSPALTACNSFTMQDTKPDTNFVPGCHETRIVSTVVTDHACVDKAGATTNGAIIMGVYKSSVQPLLFRGQA